MNYDTVNFQLDSSYYDSENFLDYFNSKLESPELKNSDKYGYSITGVVNNSKVYINKNNLKIEKTSLPKAIKGFNHYPITLSEVKEWIETTSDILKLPFKEAKVKRLDFCHDLVMNEPTMAYVNNLDSMPRYVKWEMDAGVYFKQKSNQFLIYDKSKERSLAGCDIDTYQSNLLRLEYKLTKAVQRQCKGYSMNAETLYNPNFYNSMISLWSNKYSKIRKKTKSYFKMTAPDKPKDFFKSLQAIALTQIGVEQIQAQLEYWYLSKKIDYSTKYRIESELRKGFGLMGFENIDLMNELDKKVLEAVKHSYL